MADVKENIGLLIKDGGVDKDHKDKPALISWSSKHTRVVETLSFAQLSFVAKRVCEELKKHGIRPGDPVALLSHPTIDYHIAVCGVLSLGGVVVNINWRQNLDTMQYMASLGRSVRILTSRHFVEIASQIIPSTATSKSVIIIDRIEHVDLEAIERMASKRGFQFDLLHGYIQETPEPPEPPPPSLSTVSGNTTLGQDIATVMFTSGSTGTPKAVPLTHQGLLWSCRQKLAAHGGSDAVKRGTLSFLPNYHVMGFTNNFIFNVCVARCPAFIHADCEKIPLR